MIWCSACISTPVNPSETVVDRNIEVRLKVPDMGWRIRIEEIHRMGGELWVISSLHRHPGMAAQAITTISDNIRMRLPDGPVQHVIVGKTWKWENREPYMFINDWEEIRSRLKSGQMLYQKIAD